MPPHWTVFPDTTHLASRQAKKPSTSQLITRADEIKQSSLPQHFQTFLEVTLPTQTSSMLKSQQATKCPLLERLIIRSHRVSMAYYLLPPSLTCVTGVRSQGRSSIEQLGPQIGLHYLTLLLPRASSPQHCSPCPGSPKRPLWVSSPVCRHRGGSSSRCSAFPLRSACASTPREWTWSGSRAAPRAWGEWPSHRAPGRGSWRKKLAESAVWSASLRWGCPSSLPPESVPVCTVVPLHPLI